LILNERGDSHEDDFADLFGDCRWDWSFDFNSCRYSRPIPQVAFVTKASLRNAKPIIVGDDGLRYLSPEIESR
jgi:hypothetical protein